jgi:hypothetical protein
MESDGGGKRGGRRRNDVRNLRGCRPKKSFADVLCDVIYAALLFETKSMDANTRYLTEHAFNFHVKDAMM